ncbi:MAG: exonuclease subunit SbcD [Isosphaeraceae bacterium]|nr:exonuclease subunit SbcD [Isosphaeraceae bacterium]
MKILHTADWHLGDRLGRIDRTADLRRGVERIAAYCASEGVDVLLVAGDLFSELSRPDGLRETIGHLQEVFVPFLRRGGTIVALTGNHDNETFCRTLRHALTLAAPDGGEDGAVVPSGRLHWAAGPAFFRLPDRATGGLVQFVLMPYPTPGRYLDAPSRRYGDYIERNKVLRRAYADRLAAIRSDPRFDPGLPTVLAAHVHIEGVAISGLFRISERESIVVGGEHVQDGWAYVALGHIHQPQCLAGQPHVRYCGSLDRLDLGERDDRKGVILVEIGPEGRRGEPVSLPLEATPMYDVVIANPAAELPTLRARYPDAASALVRIDLTYKAGTDNLEAILRELDEIFPRWYDRHWQEAGALGPRIAGPGAPSLQRSVHDTVIDYLKTELIGHPDLDEVLRLAEDLLAEDRP